MFVFAHSCLTRSQVTAFRVEFVSKPQLGSDVPAEVRAVVEVNLSKLAPHIRAEWDALREHDIVFMMALAEPKRSADEPSAPVRKDVARQMRARDSVVSVRGAEVVQVLDEAGKLLNDAADGGDRTRLPAGFKRSIRLQLDPAQYHHDSLAGNLAVYDGFNILVRVLFTALRCPCFVVSQPFLFVCASPTASPPP